MKPLRSRAPITSILSPDFAYRPSGQTDIRRTFRAARKRQQDKPLPNVVPMKAKR